jgi:glycosyltransferase involved in cell wall biosynthesis
MSSVSVVVPVKDGGRYLEELLAALAREDVSETLVIDSGSRDGSVEIARASGAEVVEIPPDEFGHGRTRNLGAERTSGELICFLTQDATPIEGWLRSYREAFDLDDRVGAAYGPHLPRPDTSPMIARELIEFFRGFSPDGGPVVQRDGDPPFLSNVNACCSRACWEQVRFRDVPYAEDQAFGRDMLDRGWAKVFHPGAAVLHAHDYGALEFMRRYFDEYRGLRATTGHVEPFAMRRAARDVRDQVAADRRWMRERGFPPARRAAWTGRAFVHHAGRKTFAALGSRAERLPAPLRRAVSLEGRSDGGGPPPAKAVPALGYYVHEYSAMARFAREGAAPLLDPVPGMAERDRLHIAVVIPPYRRGSGGHNTIFQIVTRLERMGHTCSVWLDDPFYQQQSEWPAVVRQGIIDHFAPIRGPVFKGFDRWYGADVVMATGWQTVYPTMLLDACRARAYFVNDHEPEFYATSVESRWAEDTYRLGLYCIAASPWLRDLLVERYGASAGDFQLGVDHDVYFPRPVERRWDTVLFYARTVTPRRGVPLGVLALEELHRRRPEVRIVMFGGLEPFETTFPYEDLGIVTKPELAWVYSQSTVGLCLSMTNFSLIPKEMLACGLPCVELGGVSAESIFGVDGPIELAAFDAVAIADGLERLLSDEALWERRSREGLEFVASHTWDAAAEQVETGLREALRERERERAGAPIGGS